MTECHNITQSVWKVMSTWWSNAGASHRNETILATQNIWQRGSHLSNYTDIDISSNTKGLEKLNVKLPCDAAIPILSIQPLKMKISIKKYIFKWKVTAALGTVLKRWKQPTHPSNDAQIGIMRHVETMEISHFMSLWYTLQCKWALKIC